MQTEDRDVRLIAWYRACCHSLAAIISIGEDTITGASDIEEDGVSGTKKNLTSPHGLQVSSLFGQFKNDKQLYDLSAFPQVAGIKGMLIANKRDDNQVKTYITYNKGRDWRLLQAPTADLEGNDIHCILVGGTARHTSSEDV